ncbi:MAG: galactose oxidase-like domain-containing protein [Nevskiales bacterium]
MNTRTQLARLCALGFYLMLAGCSSDSNRSARASGSGNSPTTSVGQAQCSGDECMTKGGFSAPFSEPLGPSQMRAAAKQQTGTPPNPLRPIPQDDRCLRAADGRPTECKPAGASVALLHDGRILYFNALEGTEDAEFSIFFEAGSVVTNDQTRVMSFGSNRASWIRPSPIDGGANPDGYDHTTLLPEGTIDTANHSTNNDGALFCADLEQLADGRILAVGGTDYYFEPGISTPFLYGVSELEGLRNARVFNPQDNSWSKTGDMHYGRWYPSLVTLPNGDVLVAGGVTKLLKPIYPERPETSGRNVVQTETYDLGCGTWTENGGLAERSLPLYPRLHLLPNGQVLFNGAGQAFNPFGQAYDQALWNIVAAYDPATKSWTDLAYAGLPLRLNEVGLERLGTLLNPTSGSQAEDLPHTLEGLVGTLTEDPTALLAPFAESFSGDPQSAILSLIGAGFRGSTTSLMLPLKPHPETGRYDRAQFLTAGGVFGAVTVNSPGSYITTALARVDTVLINDDDSLRYESQMVGSLATPRWFGTALLLPTGQAMVFSGADRDEVVLPGTGAPILVSELFDPESGTFRQMATQGQPRTYHNTALLLPDGRVLIGGHAPINTAYGFSIDLPGLSPNMGRDPSFEIYSPPYIFMDRPSIAGVPARLTPGQSFNVSTSDASKIESAVLIRRTSLTHLVDGDQRSVELPILRRAGASLGLRLPAEKAVVPPGPYMLFINRRQGEQLVPSVSMPVMVNGADIACSATP